jgi:hypothetical protein
MARGRTASAARKGVDRMLMSLAVNTKKSHLQEQKTKAPMISEPSPLKYFLFS